jgi:methanogenic corrinoid protein MtbC1
MQPEDLSAILRAVTTFDSATLRSLLEADWARLGTMAFVTDRIAPLLKHVGDGWLAGTLEIRHEHFLSEQLADLMRTLRVLQESSARGPFVVFATLPGETHALGLQMAALVAAAAGCRALYLGTDVPVAQIAALTLDTGALGVALSISSAAEMSQVEHHLAELRASLPAVVGLVVGGDGAPRRSPNAQVLDGFGDLQRWYEHLGR